MNPRRATAVACILFLAGLLTLLLRNNCFFASGPDSSGYLSEAQLFASGRLQARVTPLREFGLPASMIDVFVPLGFFPGEGEMMVPTYAPGLPLHMLLLLPLGGWNVGPFLVSPFAAIGCLLLLYALARELGVSRGWALVAPLLLAPCASFLVYAMQPMSDVLATFWILLAMWSALRSRRVPAMAVVAGFALAVAVAVRPTNALAVLPLAVALPRSMRAWGGLAAGGVAPGATLLWLNSIQYGSPFRFGFASVGDVLTGSLPPVCGGFHLWWTMRLLSPAAAALALVCVALRSIPHRDRLLLTAWFGVFFAFYAFYGYCPNWTANRFLLPAFPAVIVAALLVLQRIRMRWIAVVAVLAILLLVNDVTSEFRVFRIDDHESVFPETVAWTARNVPSNAVVVSGVFSGAFHASGRWTVRWDRLDAAKFAMLRERIDRPWYAVISDGEVPRQEFLARVPGRWLPIGRNRDVTLYRLE